MKIVNISTLILLILLSANSYSKSDGVKLLRGCKAAGLALDGKNLNQEGFVEEAYCLGLIRGVYNSISIFGQEQLKVCLPEQGIGINQQVKIVVKFLEDNPKELHETDWLLVMLSFQGAYKCQ
jgi:hypothetical protein